MNNFIASGNGFLKSIKFDIEIKQHVLEWTGVLREAQKFKRGKALDIIERYSIFGFVWNPYVEEPIRNKWEVLQRREFSLIIDDINKSLEWKPEKVKMKSKTDVSYLLSKGVDNTNYYDSYEEALSVCNVKNLEMINELQTKILAMERNKM